MVVVVEISGLVSVGLLSIDLAAASGRLSSVFEGIDGSVSMKRAE